VNVFCCYADGFLRPETERALHGIATFVALEDDNAYHRFFRERWAKGERFINVEHDCAPTAAQLLELWACRHEWCSCGYHEQGDLIPFFGCVKFSSDFIRVHENLWDGEPRHWNGLDSHLAANANVYFKPHLHGSIWHAKYHK
jgi:hypothetical protein